MWSKILILVAVLATNIPIPDAYNIHCDRYGTTVDSKIWYICVYLILTILFDLTSKLTGQLFFKVLALLSAGKLIDQFWNPYGYHYAELGWDIIVVLWTAWQIRKRCINGKTR